NELEAFERASTQQASVEKKSGLLSIIEDFKKMPATMRKLGWVQFFSWFALFMMWVYMTPAVADHVFYKQQGDRDQLYSQAADWVGILFGVYNGVSAVYAIFLPRLVRQWGRVKCHSFALLVGGISLLSL